MMRDIDPNGSALASIDFNTLSPPLLLVLLLPRLLLLELLPPLGGLVLGRPHCVAFCQARARVKRERQEEVDRCRRFC